MKCIFSLEWNFANVLFYIKFISDNNVIAKDCHIRDVISSVIKTYSLEKTKKIEALCS